MLDKLALLIEPVIGGQIEEGFYEEFLPLMRFFIRAKGVEGPKSSFENTVLSVEASGFRSDKTVNELFEHAIIAFANSFQFGWISHLKVWNSSVLNAILNRVQSPGMLPIGLLFFDVRKMKDLNRRYGHAQTDLLLAKFAEVVEKSTYSQVLLKGCKTLSEKLERGETEKRSLPRILGRTLGGDEFALILPFSRTEKELEPWMLEAYLRDIARFIEWELKKPEHALNLKVLDSDVISEVETFEDANIKVDSGVTLLTKVNSILSIEVLFNEAYETQIRKKKELSV